MGRQWNQIIDSLGPLTGGTISINANLGDIDAVLTTLQADIANGIDVNHLTDGTQKTKIVDASGNNISYITAGTAGTPSSNVLSVQGITGATPISASITSGTFSSGTLSANIVPFRGSTTIGTLTAGTTNGTLFASNSTRNYLLVQCTSGTAYIDTNGTATAGDGVLLTSGQGITFEGSFIPTGAIAAITSTGTARLIGRQG